MKLEIMYATFCEATVYETNGDSWSYNYQFKTLKDAIKWAQFQIEARPISFEIKRIYISSCDTGEILAMCTPDDVDEDSSDESYWDDWDYNEDMGFDPYMGCYSDDC